MLLFACPAVLVRPRASLAAQHCTTAHPTHPLHPPRPQTPRFNRAALDVPKLWSLVSQHGGYDEVRCLLVHSQFNRVSPGAGRPCSACNAVQARAPILAVWHGTRPILGSSACY